MALDIAGEFVANATLQNISNASNSTLPGLSQISTVGKILANNSLQNVAQIHSVGDYFSTIDTLVLYIAGMVIYSVFIFKFYRFLARRQIIKFKFHKYYEGFTGFVEKLRQTIIYIIENLVLMPLLVFFWFLVLSVFILFLGNNTEPNSILTVSMAIVAAVRITAYYNEDLSRDLAKMIPFALLGIFIINLNFSLDNVIAVYQQLPLFLDKLVFYLSFVVLLEFVMSIIYSVTKPFRKKKKEEDMVLDS